MTDEKERVNWSALMDAHGIDPDADTRAPAVEPDHRKVAEAEAKAARTAPRRSRTVNAIIAVTALFSIAASVAVLVVLLRGKGSEEARAEPALQPVGPRPAAFEQTSDGVIVVPPVPEEPPPPQSDTTSAPAAEMSARKPADIKKADIEPADKKADIKKADIEPADKKADKKADIKPADKKADIEAASEAVEGADANLPDEPDQAAVAAALDGLKKDIAGCATPAGISGPVGLKMRIEPDGKVAWASAKVQSSPFQSCLDRLFKKARMPRSAKGATVRQTIELP